MKDGGSGLASAIPKRTCALITIRASLRVFVLAIGAGFLWACQNPPQDSSAIQLIKDNLAFAQSEDLGAYLSTIHRSSPVKNQTRASLQQLFDTYDLHYTIDSIEVTSLAENEAFVRVIQTTFKVNGPQFRNNRIEVTNELRRQDGDWKLYDSKINKIDYLE